MRELRSAKTLEQFQKTIEGNKAKNFKVYAGIWKSVGKGKRIIVPHMERPLCSLPSPNGLLEWLKGQSRRQLRSPIVITAELPPSMQVQAGPRDYEREIEKVSAIRSEVRGILDFGKAWPAVKRLAQIEREIPYTCDPIALHGEREQLKQILLDNYSATARELGLPLPQQKEQGVLKSRRAQISGETTEGLEKKLVDKGEFCDQVISEIKRIKNLATGSGRSVAEIETEHPAFAVWKVRTSLSPEDQEGFAHPNQWGPPVGFAKLILSKIQDVSVHTIDAWVKAYRKARKTKKS